MNYKNLIIILLLSLFSVNIFAQESYFGIKTGITSSSYAKDYQSISDSRTGVFVGGFYHFGINEMLGIQAELLYVRHGANNIFYSGNTGSTNELIHKLDVPILINFVPTGLNNTDIVPRLYIGNAFGYNLKVTSYETHSRTLGDGTITETIQKDNITSKFRPFDLGAVIGAGINFKTSSYTIGFDANYRIGYTDVRNDNIKSITTNIFSFGVNVSF